MSDEPRSARAIDSPVGEEPQPGTRSGCLPRFERVLVAALMVLLAVFLSVVVIGLIASYAFGDILATPREVNDLRQENQSLQQTVLALQAQAAQLSLTGSNVEEDVSELGGEIDSLDQQLDAMEQEARDLSQMSSNLEEQVDEVATIQAEAEDERFTIAVIATVQSERADQITRIEQDLGELRARTDRIYRFIQRLNALSGDISEEDLEPPVTTPTPVVVTATSGVPPTPPAAATPTPTEPTATSVRTVTPAAPPAPAAAPTATPTNAAGSRETSRYVIQPGDTLVAIANRFNVTVTALLEANNMSIEAADLILPGQELIIPVP